MSERRYASLPERRTASLPELVERMKANIEKFNKEDSTVFDQDEQYLFESIKTLDDLYDFLDRHAQIDSWDQSEVFGFTLCLVSETGSVGFDGGSQVSDEYGKAIGNLLYRIE